MIYSVFNNTSSSVYYLIPDEVFDAVVVVVDISVTLVHNRRLLTKDGIINGLRLATTASAAAASAAAASAAAASAAAAAAASAAFA